MLAFVQERGVWYFAEDLDWESERKSELCVLWELTNNDDREAKLTETNERLVLELN